MHVNKIAKTLINKGFSAIFCVKNLLKITPIVYKCIIGMTVGNECGEWGTPHTEYSLSPITPNLIPIQSLHIHTL